MLQSTVNFLGNTSAVWNNEYLKKIFRIPEDQLKILNNIPGWASETDLNKPASSVTAPVNKDNQLTSLTPEIRTNTVSEKNSLLNFKETAKHIDSNELRQSSILPVNKVTQLSSAVPQPQTNTSANNENIPLENSKETRKLIDCNKHKPSLISSVNKDKQLTLSIDQAETIVIADSQKNRVTISSNTEDFKRKYFPLRKSLSLNSLRIHKANLSRKTLRRSSSTSNLKEKAATFNNTLDSLNSNLKKTIISAEKSLANIKEVEEMEVDIDRPSFEKSNFSSSGIQCKMSQDLSLESDSSQALSLSSTNHLMKGEKLNEFPLATPMPEKLNSIENMNNHLTDAGVLFKESLNVKSKMDVMNIDESYISQPVPCAQPPSENVCPIKELISEQKESASASQNKYFSSNDDQMRLDNSCPSSGKRKRRSRHEKSKKLRGANAEFVKIKYSPEQIKTIIELMKVLNKY